MTHRKMVSMIGSLAMSLAAVGCGGGTMLHVVPDESNIERNLGRFLEEHGLKVRLVNAQVSDEAVLFDFAKDQNTPEFRMVIDTQISNGEPGKVKGRVVKLSLLSHVTVPPERRMAALQVINAHHFSIWAGCFFINEKDGEVEAQWPINIESEYGVASEQVEDAVQRLVQSWTVLYPKLAEALKGDGEDPERPELKTALL